jgi:hypothetical protein
MQTSRASQGRRRKRTDEQGDIRSDRTTGRTRRGKESFHSTVSQNLHPSPKGCRRTLSKITRPGLPTSFHCSMGSGAFKRVAPRIRSHSFEHRQMVRTRVRPILQSWECWLGSSWVIGATSCVRRRGLEDAGVGGTAYGSGWKVCGQPPCDWVLTRLLCRAALFVCAIGCWFGDAVFSIWRMYGLASAKSSISYRHLRPDCLLPPSNGNSQPSEPLRQIEESQVPRRREGRESLRVGD